MTRDVVQDIEPTKSAARPTALNLPVRIGVAAGFVCQAVLLVLAGVQNRYMLNPDATAYIQIAKEYASGQFFVAVCGYWGPMLSWLMAPMSAVWQDPQVLGRIMMGLSAVFFLCGCVSLLRTLNVHPAALVLGTWLVALASISWSVENITPDLLMSGFLLLAISRTLRSTWVTTRKEQYIAGILYGLSYLTKAVAFPVSFGIVLGCAALWIFSLRSTPKPVMKAAATTLIVLVIVGAPWMGTLSVKYHQIVLSTSGRINHAIVGPPDVQRRAPNVYEKPEPGRISAGEDPTYLPFKYWSPFESVEYFKYQLKLIHSNAVMEADFLYNFDRLHIGLIAVLFGLMFHTPWRKQMAADCWRWAAVPIVCVCSIYLPVYAFDLRYYYSAYPFLIAAAIGMVVSLTRGFQGGLNVPRMLGIGIVGLSFLQPLTASVPTALKGLPNTAAIGSADIAREIRSAKIPGPVAGAGLCGAYYGQYVAFLIEQQYYGCEDRPALERIKGSGARVIIVARNSAISSQLDGDASFVNLDGVLFKSPDRAAKSLLKAYRIEVPNS